MSENQTKPAYDVPGSPYIQFPALAVPDAERPALRFEIARDPSGEWYVSDNLTVNYGDGPTLPHAFINYATALVALCMMNLTDLTKERDEARAALDAAEAERDRRRAALEWYADAGNYLPYVRSEVAADLSTVPWARPDVMTDEGDRARAALTPTARPDRTGDER